MSDTTDTDTGAEDYDKILGDLEADRDHWKQRGETAEATVTELQQRAETAEAAAREAQEALEAAEKAAQTAQETPEPDPAVDDTGQNPDEAQGSNQDRRGVRQRLAEAEAERDTLRDTVARQRQAVYDDALSRAGVTGVLMTAADRGLNTFVGDDGVIQPTAVTEAAAQVAAEVGVPRRPKADPLLGSGGSGSPTKVTIGTLLQAAVRDGQNVG
jgi:hypothetical protein